MPMAPKKKASPKKKVAKKKAVKKKLHPFKKSINAWNQVKVMDYVCDQLATSSKGLGSIITQAREETGNFPSYSSIMAWISKDSKLLEMYVRAKEAQADYMADELLQIVDYEVDDIVMVDGAPLMVDGKPVKAKSNVGVQHAKLRADTRKWLAAKLKPNKYGEKTTSVLTGPDGGALQVESKTMSVVQGVAAKK